MDIKVSDTIEKAVGQLLDTGLDTLSAELAPDEDKPVHLQVCCREADGAVIGGLIGNTGNGWLHIWQFWVTEAHRGQGIGSRILIAAEAEAVRRGCTRAHVETLSFQAPKFYADHGYEEFGVLPGYVGTHAQHYFRKVL
ncbi:MAG: GNAT family N-acetyltransferase [Pseudomonadota bacterium]